MFKFRNIDSFLRGRFEKVGTLKGKRWYTDTKTSRYGLFKPQRNEHGDKSVFCANHYGEFIGYLLARNVLIPTCEAELANLTKYYKDIYKERYGGTPVNKNGCIIYSLLKPGEILEPGLVTIEKAMKLHEDDFKDITKNERRSNENDNIEVILKAIQHRTRDFYKTNNTKNYSEDDIEKKVAYNVDKTIQMMVYDCLYGNNDRHDENWSMVIMNDCSDIALYPLYDNERILGLYENQRTIETALRKNIVFELSEKTLFSRMRVPGEKKENSTYKDVLKYLIHKYPNQTKSAMQKQLSINTPEKVVSFLEDCENLPKCYVEFGKEMYADRYLFARDLLNRNLELEETRENGRY